MMWDELYKRWNDALASRRNSEAQEHLQVARKRISQNSAEDWDWLQSALVDPARKWFVARLFVRQPIPRRLFAPMMRAAVVDVDASSNKWMITPCLETFGREAVLAELEQLREAGVATEERYNQASYWLNGDAGFIRATRPEAE